MTNRERSMPLRAALVAGLFAVGASLGTTVPVGAQVPNADLSITKADDPDPVAPGGGLRYDIAVTNGGPADAVNVTVVDTLPPEVSYVFDTDACVEAPAGTLTCSLGDLPAGETTGFSVFVGVDPATAPGVILNTAEVSAVNIDPDPNDNVVDEDTLVDGHPVTPINHALCHEVDQVKLPARAGVVVQDEIGNGTFTVRRLKRLCTPVDKNGEDPNAPLEPEHLTGYEVRQTAGTSPIVRDQEIINQFGSQTIDIGRPRILLVPTAKSLVGPPAPLAPPIDHYLCRSARGSRTRVNGLALVDQLGSYEGAVKRPYRLCTPADTNGSGIQDPASHLLCYRVRTKPSRAAIQGPLYISNPFDDLEIGVTGVRELCVPTTLVPPPAEPQPTMTPAPGPTSPNPGPTSPNPGPTSPNPGPTSPNPGPTSPAPSGSPTMVPSPSPTPTVIIIN